MISRALSAILLVTLSTPLTLSAQPYAYVVADLDDTVAVIDTATQTIVDSIPYSLDFLRAYTEFHPSGDRTYLANSFDGSITVIDTTTQTITNTIASGASVMALPRNLYLTITPDGERLYMTDNHADEVIVIDTDSETVIDTIAVGDFPVGIAAHPDGQRIYVSNTLDSTISVIDTATHGVSTGPPVSTFELGTELALSPDGNILVVRVPFGLLFIDTATEVVLGTLTVGTLGGNPGGIAFSPDGARLYFATSSNQELFVIDTVSRSLVGSVPLDKLPTGVDVTPDGSQVYVVGTATVLIIDTESLMVETVLPIGPSLSTRGRFIGGTPPTPVVEVPSLDRSGLVILMVCMATLAVGRLRQRLR